MDLLETELATFKGRLPELLRGHEGQFVVIHGPEVHSFWPSQDEAYAAGTEAFGLEPFLVMPVVKKQKPRVFLSFSSVQCPPSTDR
jgi:hypothetical protein